MKLSVVILNYQQSGLVKQLLKNLNIDKLPPETEVLVVDNHSEDGCVAMVQKNFPWVKIIAANRNLGFSGGNNLALQQARGEFILMLNPDVAVQPEAVNRLLEFIRVYPRVGIVAPRLINPDGSVQDSCYRFPGLLTPIYRRTFFKKIPGVKRRLANYTMRDFDRQHNRPVPWVLGGCLLIRREAMREVGLLDERFFLYFEDIDWCRRFWEKNWRVYYFAEAEMVHYHQRLSAEYNGLASIFNKQMHWHIVSWLKYIIKYRHRQEPTVQ